MQPFRPHARDGTSTRRGDDLQEQFALAKAAVLHVTAAFILITLFVLASRYFRETWIFATAQNLQLHLGIVCIVASLFCLLLSRNLLVWALLVASIAVTGHALFMAQKYAVAGPGSAFAREPGFRLISFNLLNINIGNGERIAEMLALSGADFIVTVESNPLIPYREMLARTYPYQLACDEEDYCGVLLLSKRPFLATEKRTVGQGGAEPVLMATVELDNTPVRIVGTHLSKPYFDAHHQFEMRDLASIIAQIPEPVVLAGDFNATTIAPDMQRFLGQSGMHTAFPEPATWPISAGPFGAAIDHVYAREPVQLRSVSRIDDPMGSNHYGLMAEFSVAAPE